MKQGRMSQQGVKYYLEGLSRPTPDDGIPENPDIPKYLISALNKNKIANKFSRLCASLRLRARKCLIIFG